MTGDSVKPQLSCSLRSIDRTNPSVERERTMQDIPTEEVQTLYRNYYGVFRVWHTMDH